MTKSHVAPHFDHLFVRNAMAPLMVLSRSHGANTYAAASHDTNASDICYAYANVDVSGIT